MKPAKKPSRILRQIIASNYSSLLKETWSIPTKDQEINWKGLTNEALSLGLAPLLYFTLQRTKVDPTQQVKEVLQKSYLSSATHNMLALDNLNRIVDSLDGARVQNILLKGASLVQTVYPDPALRPMFDLDLLIPFSQFSRAVEAVARIGYVQSQPFPYLDDTGLFWSQTALNNGDSLAKVLELHWHLLDNPYYAQRIPFAELWSRSTSHKLERSSTRSLAPDDLVIHLCAHNVFHHSGNYQRTAVDLGMILDYYKDRFNWERFLENVVAYELTSATKISLKKAREDWYVAVPDRILDELNKYPTRGRERFFLASQDSEFLKVLRSFVTIPGIFPKLRFAWGQLFPRPEYMRWRYAIKPTTPLPIAYSRRYLSGITNLVSEIAGKSHRNI